MKRIINLKNKFNKFDDYWSPKIIASFNDQEIKLVKIKGNFISHKHDETDEVFIVLKGKLNIEFEDKTLIISEGEMIVIPSGELHKPYSDQECELILIERKNTLNTGNKKNDLTSLKNIWI